MISGRSSIIETEIDQQKMRLVVKMVVISETVTVYVDVFALAAPVVAGGRAHTAPGRDMRQTAQITDNRAVPGNA